MDHEFFSVQLEYLPSSLSSGGFFCKVLMARGLTYGNKWFQWFLSSLDLFKPTGIYKRLVTRLTTIDYPALLYLLSIEYIEKYEFLNLNLKSGEWSWIHLCPA